ncbi:hypothetical protein HYALB_00008370 [Hymenoscyphus albidus]|uniref:Uncharacterized protein n=1 Tax=Hymenoscyphus albidus TaxID=595503 RepID=A0A9N9Q738_9HELO|nr:hypothetical protein HYALB_00008370 [Hymenoscyphus albidus]
MRKPPGAERRVVPDFGPNIIQYHALKGLELQHFKNIQGLVHITQEDTVCFGFANAGVGTHVQIQVLLHAESSNLKLEESAVGVRRSL